MKTMTVKAVAARTSRCRIYPVISQQEDNALKRNRGKGGAEWGKKQKHHSAVFYDAASQFIAYKDVM